MCVKSTKKTSKFKAIFRSKEKSKRAYNKSACTERAFGEEKEKHSARLTVDIQFISAAADAPAKGCAAKAWCLHPGKNTDAQKAELGFT